ncbi:MAG: hypothetical protein QM666_07475 [Acinetobacter sp.]
MMYQYRCACCNKVLLSNDKSCPSCGSHHIRSPFGFWFFCIVACLVVAVSVMFGKIYLKNNDDIVGTKIITEIVSSDKSIVSTH